jgi:hypothetical protein
MTGRNFIDWNGNGHLDSQDLLTGVAIDTAHKDADRDSKADEDTDGPRQNSQAAASSGSGCLLGVLGALVIASIAISMA